MGVSIPGLDVLVHFRVFGMPVEHADLLTLIDKGRSLLEEEGGGDGLAAFAPEFLAAVTGDDPGMVMVFHVEHIPRPSGELMLPAGEGALHLPQVKLGGQVVCEQTVRRHALELDHHVHLPVFLVDVLQRPLRPNQRGFRQSEAIVMVQNVPLELCQILVDVRAVVILGHTLVDGEQMVIGQSLGFGDVGDHVLPEAVHAQT